METLKNCSETTIMLIIFI